MDYHTLQSGFSFSEYKIEKVLGEGGFGITYLATDLNLNKKVAIKEYMHGDLAMRHNGNSVIPKTENSEKDYNWDLKAFINEAKTLAQFEDLNIVRVLRFFQANGTAYIVMEYCEGGSLSDKFSKDKPLTENQVTDILVPLMNGLQLVHDGGVLHRGIKPDNIMFRADGTPVLIDFGAARQAIGMKSRPISAIIAEGFSPIEQYASTGNLGPWTDIYAMAAVAYNCITGLPPSSSTKRVIDEDIKQLVAKLNSSAFLKSLINAYRSIQKIAHKIFLNGLLCGKTK